MLLANVIGTQSFPFEMSQRFLLTGSWEMVPMTAPWKETDVSSARALTASLRVSLNFFRSSPLP